MEVIISSQNPVKIAASQQAFEQTWPGKPFQFTGISVPSGVSDQPKSDAETYQGALNRAQAAQAAAPSGNFWVGIEGGIEAGPNGVMAFAWMVILGERQQGIGRSAAFALPPAVVELLEQGYELGEADDRVFGAANSKQKAGAIGLLTGGRISRTNLYVPALMMALIPFLQPHHYPPADAPMARP